MMKKTMALFLVWCMVLSAGCAPGVSSTPSASASASASSAASSEAAPPVESAVPASSKKTQEPFVAAAMQFNPVLYNLDDNLQGLYAESQKLFEQGVTLLCAPEMCTTGYQYKDRSEIAPYVDTVPGKTTDRLSELTKNHGAYLVFGMAEKDAQTDLYYNTAVLLGPDGYIGKYRKTQMWEAEMHWAAWGDLQVPVFKTDIGNIALNICFDAAFFEPARLAALKGADIIVSPVNSTSQAIASAPARAVQNGLYYICINRSNSELEYHNVGASSIWSPLGKKLAEAPYLKDKSMDDTTTTHILATIDPALYQNANKQRVQERRPELYKDLMLHIGPWNYTKTPDPKEIKALALQYEPVAGDRAQNLKTVETLLTQAIQKNGQVNLVVLPELSLTGPADLVGADKLKGVAEPVGGAFFEKMQALAKQHATAIVYGFAEEENGSCYNSAALISKDGKTEGVYRKTHLSASDKAWAAAGDKIDIIQSADLGKVGIMIGEDVCFPEVAGVLAVKRADMIAIPSAWNGQYGADFEISPELSANRYPEGSEVLWDAVAIAAQSYTVVANFVGTAERYSGRSSMYTLDPLYGLDQPVVASASEQQALLCEFRTLQPEWWFNQEMMINSRRTQNYLPLIQ